MAAPKRPHYFNSQFLIVRDFQDEQTYHDELLRRHNRLMHEWGVVQGLEVKKGDNASFVIEVGSAIDRDGHEIILDDRRTLTAAEIQTARQAAGTGQDILVTIAFYEDDSGEPDDQYPGGAKNVTRKVQVPKVVATKSAAPNAITLAKISANNDISNLVRKMASSIIARGSNLGDISLDGALSFTSKSSSTPTYPQVGIDYDLANDQFRVRARNDGASSLDLTHLSIKRTTGLVGIGTNSPTQKLEVAGALKLTHGPNVNNDNIGAYFWDQPEVGPTIAGKNFEVWTGGNAISLRINPNGNVGIGTIAPGSKVHIVGLSSGMPSTTGSSQSGGKVLRLGGKKDGTPGPVLDLGTAGDKGFWLQSTNPDDLKNNYPLLLNPNGGNVGIGTTEPGHALEVHGALKLGSAPVVTPDQNAAYFWNQGNVGPTIGGWGFEVRTGSNTPRFKINSTGNFGIFGNVHIGEDVPGAMDQPMRLHVVGKGSDMPAITGTVQSAGHVARLRGTTTGSTASPVLDIGSGGNKGFWIQSTDPADLKKDYPLLLNPNGGDIGIGANLSIGNSLGIGGNLVVDGNVGIGTREPQSSLHIRKDVYQQLGPTLELMNGLGGEKAKVHIDLYTYYDANRKEPEARIIAEDNGHGTANLIFKTKEHDGKDLQERVKIDSSTGEVHVAGSISCGGKITIRSPHWNRNVSARDNSTVTMVTDNDYMEHFILQMACSREFKENISDLTALEAMTTLQNLTPVKYDYKNGKAFRQNLGFIAEDMPDNLASEDRKSISPFEVVPILTRVAKEQQRVIAELQETVRTLQSDATNKHKKEGTKTYGRATTKATRAIEKGF